MTISSRLRAGLGRTAFSRGRCGFGSPVGVGAVETKSLLGGRPGSCNNYRTEEKDGNGRDMDRTALRGSQRWHKVKFAPLWHVCNCAFRFRQATEYCVEHTRCLLVISKQSPSSRGTSQLALFLLPDNTGRQAGRQPRRRW